jgi:hypothetical protein
LLNSDIIKSHAFAEEVEYLQQLLEQSYILVPSIYSWFYHTTVDRLEIVCFETGAQSPRHLQRYRVWENFMPCNNEVDPRSESEKICFHIGVVAMDSWQERLSSLPRQAIEQNLPITQFIHALEVCELEIEIFVQ